MPGWSVKRLLPFISSQHNFCSGPITSAHLSPHCVARPETLTNHSIKPRGNKRQLQVQGIGSRSHRKVTVAKMLLVIHLSHQFAASKPGTTEGLDGYVSLRGYRKLQKSGHDLCILLLKYFLKYFGTHPIVYPKQGRFLPWVIQCQRVKYQFYLNIHAHSPFCFFKFKRCIFAFSSIFTISSCYHLYLLSKWHLDKNPFVIICLLLTIGYKVFLKTAWKAIIFKLFFN